MVKNYKEATEWLFTQLAVFQRTGGSAYKPGLGTALALDKAFGSPHAKYRTIHIAGTNGKGSTAHTLAAVLQSAGYRTGLYTSPHLVDFRERIRINGKMIEPEYVVDFVNRFSDMDIGVSPSFFELTMTMAFEYFQRGNVDVAVIEAGLGGRLDSTNIITPKVSIITNISYDHTQFLGTTLEAIAGEKAGIIKRGVPVVVGESEGSVRKVFADKAQQMQAPIIYADDSDEIESYTVGAERMTYSTRSFGALEGELTGEWQRRNAATILEAVKQLRQAGFVIPDEAVREGFAKVCELTGLTGRWMVSGHSPLRVCDTGHDTGGWAHLAPRLAACPGVKHIVVGFVNDKDISGILRIMATIPSARFYFTAAAIPRSLAPEALAEKAAEAGLRGEVVPGVAEAYRKALANAGADDTVFVGGSNFVVADLLCGM